MAPLVECHSSAQKFADSLSGQGIRLIAGSLPSRGVYYRQPTDVSHIYVSVPLFLPLLPSL